MQFAAVLLDSLRESIDRKIFWVMLAISSLILLTLISIGFRDGNVTFMFGLWETDAGNFDPLNVDGTQLLVSAVIEGTFDVVLGFIGIGLMIVATAGVFPALVEPGLVGILLSKPISRGRLFLYKYLSAMAFAAIQAVFLLGGTFLVMGLRWGVWTPGFLMTIPAVVLLFSYIFCVSALVGVATRSAVTAAISAVIAWSAFAILTNLPLLFDQYEQLRSNRWLHTTAKVMAAIPPKTSDISYFVRRWADAAPSADTIPASVRVKMEGYDDARRLEQQEMAKPALWSISSSLAFEAFVVGLGIWIFSRRDY